MWKPSEPCVGWVEGGVAQLGWGVADERTAASSADAVRLAGELAAGVHGEGPWFGGLAFPGAQGWAGFPAARFVRPERVERVALQPSRAAGAAAQVIEPMSSAWRVLVETAKRAIEAGALEKVVLARAVDVAAQPDAWSVFQALCATPAARHFFFRAEGGACFMGATPETLVRWREGRVEIDALAGSAPVGVPFGDKERREHALVVRDVVRALDGLEVEAAGAPAVMELSYLRHLHTRVRARAHGSFDLGALLARLFPTSAVAGAPREPALELIARHERLARGWYAGAVGRIAPGDVDLAVALRCLKHEGAMARVFAGAGIVAGSDAQAEWDETARKMAPALGALTASVGGTLSRHAHGKSSGVSPAERATPGGRGTP